MPHLRLIQGDGGVMHDTPKRRSDIAVELGLSPTGGHSLGMVSDAIDSALQSFHASAERLYGPEEAAVLLALLLLRDPSYAPRAWVGERIRPHRHAVVAAMQPSDPGTRVHQPRHARLDP